jgi:hypothetical protein
MLIPCPSLTFIYYYLYLLSGSRDSSESIATRLWAGRPGFDSWQGQQIFLFIPHSVQTDSGAHPASYPMGTESVIPKVKVAAA